MIDNSNGVTFNTTTAGNTSSTTLTIADNLILTSGNLNIVSNGSARVLVVNGSVTSNGNSIDFGGPSTDLTINGSGDLGTFPFPVGGETLRNLIMNRTPNGAVSFAAPLTITGTTTLTNGAVDFNNTATLSGAVSLATGTALHFEGQTLTLSGNFTSTGGTLSANNTSTLNISGTTALTSPLAFSPTGNVLGTLALNKSNAGISMTVNAPLTIAQQLTLTDGQLDIVANNLIMGNGSTITRTAAASISNTSPAGEPWSAAYTGPSVTTGLEIPVSGHVTNLTANVDNAATVTLATGQALNVTGTFSIPASGRIFTSGNNNVSITSFSNSGTFNAPGATSVTGLVLNGSFTNNGTFSHNSGTVAIAAAVTFGGSNINSTNFNNITINGGGNLIAPATLNVLGNFANNGSLTAGSGTVVFGGGTSLRTISGSNAQFNNLTISKTNGSGISVTVSSPQTVTGTLSLSDGRLENPTGNLTLNSGATLSRSNIGSIQNTSPSGGPWHLIYTGGSLTTGLEIPSDDFTVQSLSINSNSSAVVTLAVDLVVSQGITISTAATGPTFTSGSRNITAATLTNGGIFNAPINGRNLTVTGNLTNNRTFNALAGNIILSGNFTNNSTFSAGTGTIVFNGTSSILGSSSSTFNNVTISGTLNGPSNLLLTGSLTINGTFIPSTGTVSFTGTGNQNISGVTTTFNNISVTNTAAAVRVQSNQNLRGVLTLGANATFDADGSGNTSVFTILSVNDIAGSDGSIAALPSTAIIQGSVTVQRYWRANDDRSRYFSTPIQNPPVSQIQDSGIPVTGGFVGASTCVGCGIQNNLRYNDETLPGGFEDGYRSTPKDSETNAVPLLPGVGYALYMWLGETPSLLSLHGSINRGSINLPVTSTNNGVADSDGWNLVGNPYPSSILWANPNLGGWTMSNIETTVWVYDVVSRAWRSFNYANNTGNLPGGVIATGQAFWVEATAVGTPSITVHEAAKVSPGGAYLRTREEESEGLIITFTTGDFYDNAFITLDDRATKSFERGLDHRKLELGIERLSVALLADQKKVVEYATSKRDLLNDIPVAITAAEGNYELSFNSKGNTDGFNDFYLVDVFKNTFVPIGKKYDFTITGNPASTENRFYLTVKPEALLKNSEQPFVKSYPNPVNSVLHIEVNSENATKAELLNIMGQKVKDIELRTEAGHATGQIDMQTVTPGFYFIRVRDENNASHIHKIIRN
jgi:formylmethanofuran dehydrogenase subunit C